MTSSPITTITESSEEDDTMDEMTELKAMTTRLKLQTRRPSYIEWRSKLEKPSLAYYNSSDDVIGKSHQERKAEIDNALSWLRRELVDMRTQDQSLARQLMNIHREIQRLRLEQSCEAHRDMLDEVQYTIEEQDEMTDVCDMQAMDPNLLRIMKSPLGHFGVTRMNLNARRFSLC
ncbi:protein FAM167A-like [Saccoglossus kowalevskii]|uniref:Protein FAM167A-like isoform X1 n=1 Tax=Saccoglossus kowalevskii TaxID=10224 RepID=A0ABM0GW08_SACKO|nr:PREDICTED: protein FAM167A-like isoform X1 [Saccoglossus kowalevskii]XP_006821208.1 PREDICTED: protein FAM167A-like isoform X2 [Saccoglossus kowalevskii]